MTPSAVYVYDWQLFEGQPPTAMYRVSGGEFDKSDVSAETLIRLGITVPARELVAQVTPIPSLVVPAREEAAA